MNDSELTPEKMRGWASYLTTIELGFPTFAVDAFKYVEAWKRDREEVEKLRRERDRFRSDWRIANAALADEQDKVEELRRENERLRPEGMDYQTAISLLEWALNVIEHLNEGPITLADWDEDAALYAQAMSIVEYGKSFRKKGESGPVESVSEKKERIGRETGVLTDIEELRQENERLRRLQTYWGWGLRPREPSEAMKQAADRQPPCGELIWKAMWDAARMEAYDE